jgi:hypothetical protein
VTCTAYSGGLRQKCHARRQSSLVGRDLARSSLAATAVVAGRSYAANGLTGTIPIRVAFSETTGCSGSHLSTGRCCSAALCCAASSHCSSEPALLEGRRGGGRRRTSGDAPSLPLTPARGRAYHWRTAQLSLIGGWRHFCNYCQHSTFFPYQGAENLLHSAQR